MGDTISIFLPDGSTRELPAGSSGADLAASIGSRLAKAAVAAKVDGTDADLTSALADGSTVAIITADSAEGRHVLRHSTAHVLAQAVTDLWPGAKYAIGPAIEDGFYYDFDLPGGAHFSDDDLARIEARMREIIKEDQPFVRGGAQRRRGPAAVRRSALQGRDHRGRSTRLRREAPASGVVSTYRNNDGSSTCAAARTCRPPAASATSSS